MKRYKKEHSRTPERRRQIIKAALECFTAPGYSETSIADICKKAKASVGSVYHHFKSKDQLATAIYIEGIEEYQLGLVRNLVKEEEGRDGITAVIRFHLEWVEANPQWARFLFQQRHAEFMEGTEERMADLNKLFITEVSQWFGKQFKEGNIKNLSWDIIISMLLGPCQEFSRVYLLGKTVSSIENAIKDLSNSVWLSLRAD